MADLLVVTGPPGAGKSTVAALVAESFAPGALVPGDLFFSFRRRGAIAPWLAEAHEQNAVALRAAAGAAGTFAASGCAVVYDGVVGPWFLPLFAEEAARHGVRDGELHYVVLLPPLERCRQRVTERTGHGFTDADATARMHADFAAADVDPRHVVADPPGDASEVAAVVLQRYRDGRLTHRPWRPGGCSGSGAVPADGGAEHQPSLRRLDAGLALERPDQGVDVRSARHPHP